MRNSRRSRLVLALLLLTAFTLITLDLRGHSMARLRGLASDVFGPIERAVADVVHPIGSAFASLGHLGSSSSEINKLQRQNAVLNTQLRQYQAEEAELAGDRKLLGLAGSGGYTIVAAKVTGFEPLFGYEFTATIDVGSRDHIRADDTVINGDGLVGQVTSVSATTSTVDLAVDGRFTAAARIAPSGTEGFVTGHGLGSMILTLLSTTEHVHPGQGLVTAGIAPFVPGIPIGQVVANVNTPGALTRTALVRPYVDFTSLDTVGVVVVGPRTDPRFRLLPTPPASPSPSPSPSPPSSPAAPASPGASGSPRIAPSGSPRPSGSP